MSEEVEVVRIYYDIDAVLGHRGGDPVRRGGELLIKWRGFRDPT